GVRERLAAGHARQHVKVVREDGIGHNLYAAVFCHQPHLLAQDFSGGVIEKPLFVYHPRHAVIHRLIDVRIHFDTRLPHASRRAFASPSTNSDLYVILRVFDLSLLTILRAMTTSAPPPPNLLIAVTPLPRP